MVVVVLVIIMVVDMGVTIVKHCLMPLPVVKWQLTK